MTRLNFFPLAVLFLGTSLTCSLAVPTASPDDFTAYRDVELEVDAVSGVLANDGNGTDPVKVVLDQDVQDGMLVLNEDGSFTYTPGPGLTGSDPFTYHVESNELRQVDFTVDQGNSNLSTSATLSLALGDRSDSDSSQVSGTAGAAMAPAKAPFDRIQVNEATLILVDGVDLTFDYGFLLGKVGVTAAPNDLQLELVTPGPEAMANPAGVFSQTSNTVNFTGTVDVDTSGPLIGTLFADTTLTLNETGSLDLMNAKILQLATELELTVPVSLSLTSDLVPGVASISFTTTGSVRATAPLPLPADRSPTVTANIQVEDRPPFAITNVARIAPDGLMVTVATTPGLKCRLVGASDLKSWSFLDERVADTTSETFVLSSLEDDLFHVRAVQSGGTEP